MDSVIITGMFKKYYYFSLEVLSKKEQIADSGIQEASDNHFIC